MEKVTSTTEQKVPIFANPTTEGGKPATVDGRPQLAVVAGGATVANSTQEEADAYAADPANNGKTGLVGYVISEDQDGTSTIQLSADADLGEGVTTITDSFDYSYGHPNAKNLGTTAGDAVLK